MDPTPGCSSGQSGETNTVPGRTESIENLEDIFRVRHGFFKWSVENFSTFPKWYGISCFSPTFVLGETWWYLALSPRATNCGRDGISLDLIRCRRDPGPENAVASYALGLENSLSKVWFKSEENVLFKKGNQHGLQTSVLGNLTSEEAENDTLSVICEIYVSYLSKRAHKSGGRTSPIDRTLSSDLAELFNSQKQVDVLIEIRNHRMWAHKSILSARSKTLAILLESGKFFIQLSCNISCLMCVLLYMYSGSFSYLARKAVFNIGLYELACELSLRNLRDMLAPHKMEKVSRVEVRCFRKTCTIYRFEMDELSSGNIETPEGFDRESGMSVKLTLYRMNGTSETVGINIEVGGVAGVFHVDVNVSLLNKNCEPFREVPTRFLPDSPAEFKDSTLLSSFVVSTADVLPSVTNGNLFINVECTKYSLKNVSTIPSSVGSLSNDCKNWIECLSSDLKKLFKTEKLSDITLIVKRQRFKVHRSILAARTPLFYKLFYEKNYDQKVLGIRDIEPRTLWLILAYIYCGTISHVHDLTIEDFSKLYEVSMKCKIPSLVELCAQFLSL